MSDESNTKRDGYLSTRAEWHAAMWGLSVGILSGVAGRVEILIAGVGWIFSCTADSKIPDYVPYPKQLVSESAYMIAHAAFGFLLTYILFHFI